MFFNPWFHNNGAMWKIRICKIQLSRYNRNYLYNLYLFVFMHM